MTERLYIIPTELTDLRHISDGNLVGLHVDWTVRYPDGHYEKFGGKLLIDKLLPRSDWVGTGMAWYRKLREAWVEKSTYAPHFLDLEEDRVRAAFIELSVG
jgi:hypothetical protein